MKRNEKTESGSIRLGLFLLAITVGMLWAGGQNLYTALSNRHPTTMSYEDYVTTKPSATWLVLTNCEIDLTDSCVKTYQGSRRPTEIFVPVRGVNAGKSNEVVHVVLATKDKDQLATLSEMQNLDRKEALAWILKNRQRVFCQRNVSGLVEFGVNLKDRDRQRISALLRNAANDFIILQEGAQPSIAEGLGFTIAGLMILGLMVIYVKRTREPSTADI
jgi:hypothetical protein